MQENRVSIRYYSITAACFVEEILFHYRKNHAAVKKENFMRLALSGRRKKILLIAAAAAVLLGAVFVIILASSGGQAKAKRAERLLAASRGRTDYELLLILRPDVNTLAVTETVTYTNRTGDTLNEIILRTWANAYADEESSPAALEDRCEACYGEAFSAGGIRIDGVWVQDALTEPGFIDAEKTVLSVPARLQPGESVTLKLHASVQIPVCAYRFGRAGDTFLLTSFLPVIPVYEEGAWHTESAHVVGDPFVQDAANFAFRLSVPEGWQVWGNAEVLKEGSVYTGTALAARDLSLIVSRELTAETKDVNGIRVTALGREKAGAVRGLEIAGKALRVYSELYGDYPDPVFTLVACALPFDSMEHPGVSLINEALFADEDKLEQALALSCARQWFGALAGADLFHHGWMSGALSRYAMLSYYGRTKGEGAREDLIRTLIDPAMRDPSARTFTPGMPADYFADLTTYIAVVYDKGCALMCALDLSLDGGTDAFLRAYVEKYAF